MAGGGRGEGMGEGAAPLGYERAWRGFRCGPHGPPVRARCVACALVVARPRRCMTRARVCVRPAPEGKRQKKTRAVMSDYIFRRQPMKHSIAARVRQPQGNIRWWSGLRCKSSKAKQLANRGHQI